MDAGQIKQAMDMVNKMKKIQKDLEKTDIDVESNKGEIKVVVNGTQEIKSIKIDASSINTDKIEDFEKLLLKTINNAIEKSQKLQQEQMKAVTGNINIPGLF